MAVWAYAKSGTENPKLFRSISSVLITRDLSYLTPKLLSLSIWAYGRSEIQEPLLFTKFSQEIKNRNIEEEKYNSQFFSNIVWAYSKVGLVDYDIFKIIEDLVLKKGIVCSMKPRELSMFIWAYSKASMQTWRIFDVCSNLIIDNEWMRKGSNSFDSQQISNVLYSFAYANIKDEALFNEAAESIIERQLMNYFDGQDFQRTLWSFTMLGFENKQLFEVASRYIIERKLLYSEEFLPKTVVTILWAFSKNNIVSDIYEEGRKAISERKLIEEVFQLHDFAVILYTFAKSCPNSHLIFDMISQILIERQIISDFTAHDISSIVWALNKSGYNNDTLYKLIIEAVKLKGEEWECFPSNVKKMMMTVFHMKGCDVTEIDKYFHIQK
jgi:hypothetical protein